MKTDFLFSQEGKAWLQDEYIKAKRSTYELAEERGTYPNKIRRALKHHKIKIRSKSAAQKAALKTGRQSHPTKGVGHTQESRNKISASMAKSWEQVTDEERQLRVEKARQQWENMSELQKEELQKSASEGIRKAAKEGSKTEKFLMTKFRAEGYSVAFHPEILLQAEKMHIDLFFDKLKIALEIDGPTHFLPIFGEEQLQKNIRADTKKTGLLLQSGYVIIRVKYMVKNLSSHKLLTLYNNIMQIVKQIEQCFPPKGSRLFELELS